MAIVAFAALLLRMLAAQHHAERAMRQHTHRLQELSRQLLSIKEQERRSLGRELHDRIGGNLNALLLNLEVLRQNLPGDPAPALTRQLGDSENLVRETLSNVRHILAELRPTALDELGLRAALEHHARAMEGRANLAVAVNGEEPSPRLLPAVEISLFRIAQEALNNAVRHAHASHVTLELRVEEGEVILEIADDGAGFRDGAVATIPGSGLGMVTMRERAEALGGSLEVKSSTRGTVIRVRIPATDDLPSPD
jgi:signal transduction histidine kinase